MVDTPAPQLVAQQSSSAAGSGFLSGLTGLGAGLFSGSSLLGGLSGLGDHSSATGAPQTATGWGTFNNPFIIATGGSKVDSRADQRADASLDTNQGGPSVGNPGAPLLSGDGLSTMTLLGMGLFGLVIVKAVLKRKGA